MAKELKWRGLNAEEVKALSMDKFLEMVPSRQRRSLARGYTTDQKALLKKINAGESNLKTHSRNMIVLPLMVGLTIGVYTGKEFMKILVTLDMLGHRLGEFAHTRKPVSHSSAGVGSTRSSKAVTAR